MKKRFLLLTVFLISACATNTESNLSDSNSTSKPDSVDVPVSAFQPSESVASDNQSSNSKADSSTSVSKSDSVSEVVDSQKPSNDSASNSFTSTVPDSTTSSNPSVAPDELINLGGGEINNSLPSGWTFIKGPKVETKEQYYGNGGLKFQYVGDGLLSNTFENKNHIEVKINIRSLNVKGNMANVGDNDFSFSLYGLNASGTVVAADGILRNECTASGEYNLLLEGPAITQVKLIYSSSPHDELGNYYNVSFGGIILEGNNSGDDEIKNTEPVNPDKPVDPEQPSKPTEGKLAAPTNLQVDDVNWKITWNRVSNASAYRLMLNDFNIICGDTEYANADVIWTALFDGIANTIKVQALDNYGKYEASDFTIIKYSFEEFEGIYIDKESYVKDLTIEEEDNIKIIRIPSNKLSRNSQCMEPDLVLATDYDFGAGENQFKFAYEKSDVILFTPEKETNKIKITFAGVGEFMIYVIKNGTTINDFIYDSIKIIIEPAPETNDFEVYIYDYDYDTNVEHIYKNNEYTCDSSALYGYAYINFLIKCNVEISVEHDFTIWTTLNKSDYELYYQPETETSEGNLEGFAIYLSYGYRGTFTITFETLEYGGKTLTINVI